jgi:2-polyprenyl-3-methyl-5-hydroxy-6-metoxy-1,4-benzoquinol methylase
MSTGSSQRKRRKGIARRIRKGITRRISNLQLKVSGAMRKVQNRRLAREFDPLRQEFIAPEVDSSAYNQYYQDSAFRHETSYGRRFIKDVFRNISFRTVLDAGCGSGIIVRYCLENGYVPRGIELSDWIVRNRCPDLYEAGIVQIGSLGQLPYRDNSFDLVFSSDVLEHIPENEIPQVVSELVRVAGRDLFLSISLRPSSMNNKYHVTLKPREWWERQFTNCGVSIRKDLIDRFQKRMPGASNLELLKSGISPKLLEEMSWFVEQEPYSLEGEVEPWFFAFEKPQA